MSGDIESHIQVFIESDYVDRWQLYVSFNLVLYVTQLLNYFVIFVIFPSKDVACSSAFKHMF